MLSKLQELNTLISAECGEGQSLSGCEFYEDSLQDFKVFPAVGTKLVSIETLSTHSGTIIPISNEVVLFVADTVQNHSGLVALYDATLEKLNIIFGIAKAKTDKSVDIIDTVFQGSKTGVVAAIQITI